MCLGEWPLSAFKDASCAPCLRYDTEGTLDKVYRLDMQIVCSMFGQGGMLQQVCAKSWFMCLALASTDGLVC